MTNIEDDSICKYYVNSDVKKGSNICFAENQLPFVFIPLIAISLNFSILITHYKKWKSLLGQETLEKILYVITIAEFGLSITWMIGGTVLYDIDLLVDKCSFAFFMSLFSTFLYSLDWILFCCFLHNFKKMVYDPISIQSSKLRLKIYLIISFIFSAVVVFIVYLANIYGLSPMLTCLIRDHTYSKNDFIKMVLIMTGPGLILIYIIYVIIDLLFFYMKHRSKILKRLLMKYLGYCIVFVVLYFPPIIVFGYGILTQNPKSVVSQWFIYVSCLFTMSIDLVLGALRVYFLKFDVLPSRKTTKTTSEGEKEEKLIENESGLEFLDNLETFLTKQIIMNLFVGICYSMKKAYSKKEFAIKEKNRENQSLNNLHLKSSNLNNLEHKSPFQIPTNPPDLVSKNNSNSSNISNGNESPISGGSNESFNFDDDFMLNLSKDDSQTKINKSKFHVKKHYINEKNINFQDTTMTKMGDFEFEFIEHSPNHFQKIRDLEDIDELEIIESFLPEKNKTTIENTAGKSNNFFISTEDKKFILKTITYEEVKIVNRVFLKNFILHLSKEKQSLICRIYGMYEVNAGEKIYYIIVMRNILGIISKANIIAKYDMKGSEDGRYVETAGKDIRELTLKDINFKENEDGYLALNKKDSYAIQKMCKADSVMLTSLNLMDYSLFVVKLNLKETDINDIFEFFVNKSLERDKTTTLMKYESKWSTYSKNIITLENFDYEFKNNPELKHYKKHLFLSREKDTAYIMAIIDCFQSYNLKKYLERTLKIYFLPNYSSQISCVPPLDYSKRFCEFVKKITKPKRNTQKESESSAKDLKKIILEASESKETYGSNPEEDKVPPKKVFNFLTTNSAEIIVEEEKEMEVDLEGNDKIKFKFSDLP